MDNNYYAIHIRGENMKREDLYDEYAKKLEGEYKEAYKTVDGMLSFMSGELDQLGTTMSEVVDLLLVAQEENRPVSSVLGDDLYVFCCQILKGSKISVKEAVIQRFISIRFFIIGALFFSITDLIYPVEENFLRGIRLLILILPVSLVWLILDHILLYALRPLTKYVGKLGKLLSTLKIIIYLILIWKLYDVLWESNLAIQLDQFIPLKVEVVTLAILLCWILWIHNRRKKKCSQDEEVKFSDLLFNDEFVEMVFNNEQKAYAKYLKRCKKKEKVPMDIQLWYERELKIYAFLSKWGWVPYVVVSIAIILPGMINNEFPNILDRIGYIVIFVLVFAWMSNCSVRFLRKNYICRKQIQDQMIYQNNDKD